MRRMNSYESDWTMNPQQGEEDPGAGDDDWDLGTQFADLFGSENRIREQVFDGVEQKLRTRSALGTVTDLMSVGVETLSHLLNDPGRAADRGSRGQ